MWSDCVERSFCKANDADFPSGIVFPINLEPSLVCSLHLNFKTWSDSASLLLDHWLLVVDSECCYRPNPCSGFPGVSSHMGEGNPDTCTSSSPSSFQCCPCPVSSIDLMNGRCTTCTDCHPQGDNADKVTGCRSFCRSLPGEVNTNMKVFKLYVGCRKGFDQWADCNLACSKYSLPFDA